ncbi:MAG: amidase [Gemmatimonadetes bacterium]|nr:amidase [Gemmatimonadota bacterium]MBT7862568.1 amidase [Gemmatimonadota bacterium]
MSTAHDMKWLDATAQADLVRRGQVTPAELVEASIDAIQALNPQLNAVVTPLFEEARQEAAGQLPDGPLRGVPFLLKDLGVPQAGIRMACGSRLLVDNIPDEDSEITRRYRQAGLVFVGRTNTPEFGLLPTTEPVLFGPTHNPWNPQNSPGGSSGGSAAAVAAGLVAAAHGNDGGGSIRIPAACCGLVGLKPTRGRSTLGPQGGDRISGLTAEHALTRSVRDSALLLDIIRGPSPGDPYWAMEPDRPYTEEVGAAPGTLRIGITRPVGAHPDCLAAIDAAASLCEGLGHHVDEVAVPFDVDAHDQALLAMFASGLVSTIDTISLALGRPPEPDEIEPFTQLAYEIGQTISASQYLLAVGLVQTIGRQLANFFADVDLWLVPTLNAPPLPLGTLDIDPALSTEEMAGRIFSYIGLTPVANSTGVPAISLPLHWNDAGLPVGVQFMAPYGNEARLFRLAAQLEATCPWADRHPSIAI